MRDLAAELGVRWQKDIKMDPIPLCAIIGLIFTIFLPLLMNRRSVRKKYENMSDDDLIRAKVHAEKMWKFCLVLSFLGPIPLCFLAPMLKNSTALEFVICLLILMVMVGIANFGVWWKIGMMTKAELELRNYHAGQGHT